MYRYMETQRGQRHCTRVNKEVGKGLPFSLVYLVHIELVYAISYDAAIVLHDVHVGECKCLLNFLFGCMKRQSHTFTSLMPRAGTTSVMGSYMYNVHVHVATMAAEKS